MSSSGLLMLMMMYWFLQPSWRHIPHHTQDEKSMITYKASDIKFSWANTESATDSNKPRVCGYVKEGKGIQTGKNIFEVEVRFYLCMCVTGLLKFKFEIIGGSINIKKFIIIKNFIIILVNSTEYFFVNFTSVDKIKKLFLQNWKMMMKIQVKTKK